LTAAASATGAMANVWLVRGRELQPWQQTPNTPPISIAIDADNPIAAVARTNAPASHAEISASPLTIAGEVVAVLVTASPQPPAPSPEATDVLALYASRALESITAFKTARALSRQADETASMHREPAATMSAADVENHASAQRYAKLLVSEIKLYHEADVVSGRRDRDLMARLGGEIARARMMYDQQVTPDVRQHTDYFHVELVRTLAAGDASLLEVRT